MHLYIRFTRPELRLVSTASPRGRYGYVQGEADGSMTLGMSPARLLALIRALDNAAARQSDARYTELSDALRALSDAALPKIGEGERTPNPIPEPVFYHVSRRYPDKGFSLHRVSNNQSKQVGKVFATEAEAVAAARAHHEKTKRLMESTGRVMGPVFIDSRQVNPVPASRTLRAGGSRRSGQGDLDAAARLYEEFTGNTAGRILRAELPETAAYLQVGKVDAILYTANREGQVEHYRHDFRRKSRPLLIASHDGKELRMIGGSFRFTARGIVDHDAKGNPVE